MKQALKIFLKDETSLSNYIFYKILGYNTQDQYINATIPKQLSVQGLPELNHFQMNAVRRALTTPVVDDGSFRGESDADGGCRRDAADAS